MEQLTRHKEIISSHTSPQGPNTLLSHQRNQLDSLQQSLVISLSTSLHSCCFFNPATVLLCKFWLTVKHCEILINTYAGKKNNCLLGIHYTLISRPAVRNKYLCLTWQIKHWSYFFINAHRQIVYFAEQTGATESITSAQKTCCIWKIHKLSLAGDMKLQVLEHLT